MPLPNPNNGESQNDFMARCVVDPNIVNDFGSIDQRVAVCSNLFNPPKEEKAQSTDNWPDEFEKELTKAERTSIRDFTEFYKAEYNDAIDLFLRVKAMTSASAQGFFQDSKYVGMYEGMYSKIGLQFANWYSRNVEKYLPKADAGNMQSIWANAFAFMGNQVAGQRVTLVSATAQATLTNTIRQFMSDPIFMSAGEKVQAKMLRQKFDYLADYQARRIVRTEATNAANYATEQAALNLFPGADMTKTWKSGYDARVRPAHQAANNQTVPFNSKFSVGGESLQRPGDPNGSASNVINCRCSMIVLPKAGANTIGPRITNIGFGMAQAEIVDAISPALLAPEVIATVVAETAVVEANAQKEAMRPKNWDKVVPKGTQINDDYLALLKEKPTLVKEISKTKGSKYINATDSVHINVRGYGSETIAKTLSHEFGHAIHYQQGWITRKSVDEVVAKSFVNSRNIIWANENIAKEFQYQRDEYLKLWNKYRSQFPHLTDLQYTSQLTATADTIEALTNATYGFGHGKAYYAERANSQFMEYMAHAFENKYYGNDIMKKLFPQLFDDMISMLDEMIAKTIGK
jgi:Phage Mu protein F like protein